MVKCDNCQHKFNFQLKTKRKDTIEITYFTCPECNKEYITLVTDPKLRKLIQKVQNTMEKARKSRKPKDLQAWEQAKQDARKYADEANLKGLV